jgi:hypothetical protein
MARKALRDAELHTMLRIADASDDADGCEPLPRSVLVALSGLFGADTVHFFRLDIDRCATPLYQEYGRLGDVGDEAAADQVFWSQYWASPFARIPTAPATSAA